MSDEAKARELYVDFGIRAFHAELTVKRYRYYRPGLEQEPFGLVMTVTDGFGNGFRFCERSDDVPAGRVLGQAASRPARARARTNFIGTGRLTRSTANLVNNTWTKLSHEKASGWTPDLSEEPGAGRSVLDPRAVHRHQRSTREGRT
ncbi:MAG: glyoxalase superfamily protein [Janthinobacterium lividum]